MKKQEKLNYLQDNHFSEWLKVRREQENKLSDICKYYCVCGRLATGLHQSHCTRFKNKVNDMTLKELKHLIN